MPSKMFMTSLAAATALTASAAAYAGQTMPSTTDQQATMPAQTTMPAPTPTPTPTKTPKASKSRSKTTTTTSQSSTNMPAATTSTAMPAQTAPATTAPATTAPATAAPAATAPGQAMPAAPGTAPAAPGTAATAAARPNPSVDGAAMDATKPITVNAAAAPTLSTLVSAVKAAGLDTTLSGPGPFTVFAPTNTAFSRLAPGTVDTLMKPENKATLTKVLTYHVVPGTITLDQLKAQITAGGGKATLTTVEGEPLTVSMPTAGSIELADVNGNKSYLQVPDIRQSNGIVHVVNGVLLPKLN